MPYFIAGAILSVLVIVGIFLLCFLLIKKSSKINKLTWQVYVAVIVLFILGLTAIGLVFYGGYQII